MNKQSFTSFCQKKPYQSSILTGLLLGISFPPFPTEFISLFAFVPFILTLESVLFQENISKFKGYLRVFSVSYAGLFIWNLIGCYWLMLTALSAPNAGEAFMSFLAGFAAVVCNPVVMSVPILLYAFVRQQIKREFAFIAFILFWLSFEYLHFNWDLSWSWITLGHSFSNYIYFIQFIEYTGVLGISLIILITNFLIANQLSTPATPQPSLPQPHPSFPQKRESTPHVIASVAKQSHYIWLTILCFISVWSGILYIQNTKKEPETTLRVKIIQPNIDPYAKFNEMPPTEQINILAQLTENQHRADLVIFPETALPGAFSKEEYDFYPALDSLKKITLRDSFEILSGFTEVRYHKENDKKPASAAYRNNIWYDICNATILFGKGKAQTYQKRKLVPMVERMPFLETFTFLRDYNVDIGGGYGSLGMGDSAICLKMKYKDIKIAPLVCYESIFGEFVTEFVQQGADILCIVTNDGWWKESSGHIQHAAYARLRAIETRRWIVRSANTGISMIINEKGEIIQELGWDKRGILEHNIPILKKQTFYVRYGDYLGRIALILSGLLFLSNL